MEIQLYTKLNDPITAIEKLGLMFAKSGMFGCERTEQGQVLAMICLAEMKSPTAIVRDYHIIDGKLSKKSLAALADFRGAGGKHKWIQTGDEAAKDDDKEAIGEFEFQGNKLTVKFSMADAKKAMLFRPRSAWEKQPANMLRARVISNAVAMLAPEIYAGDAGEDESQPVAKVISMTVNPTEARAGGVIVDMPKQGTNVSLTSTTTGEVIKGTATVIDSATETIDVDVESELAPLPFNISEELANQVVAAIGAHLADVVDWMVEQDEKAKSKGKPGWISREQINMHKENPFRFLTAARAQQVLSATPQCLGVVKQWKEAKGKA